ncbi:MAG: lysophospholipid acyltransferase family protein [Pirellulaceae bacterium]
MGYRQIKNWLTYLLVRMLICIIQSLPLRFCQRFSRFMAKLAWQGLRIRRQVIEENLRHAFPYLSQGQRDMIALDMWSHLCLMVCEIAHTARKIHRTNWRNHIRLKRARQLVGLLLSDRPTVLVSGHFGNFEVAGYAAGLYGFSNYTIARPLDNPYLDRFIGNFRRLNGQYILPKQGSASKIQKILGGRGTLVLLGDQYAGQKGCWVDFFGRPASCHKGIALFSLTNNAPLATCYSKRTSGPLTFELGLADIFDPATETETDPDIASVTQWYNEVLEAVVEETPGQYWWVHRRWKGHPPPIPPSVDT